MHATYAGTSTSAQPGLHDDGTPPPHDSVFSSQHSALMSLLILTKSATVAQWSEPCAGGVPASCNSGCAAVLVPAYAACTAEGGYLAQPFMSGTEVVFAKAAAMCGRGNGHLAAPPLKCATLNDYNTLAKDVTAECCDEESCTTGLPTTCDAGCAAVLLPAEKACTLEGGWFTRPQNTQTKAIYHKAAALCKKPSNQGDAGAPPCTTAANFRIFSWFVTTECCDEKTESCTGGIPQTCNAGCAAVLGPTTRACIAAGGFLKSAEMRATKAVFVKAAAKCASAQPPPQCQPPSCWPEVYRFTGTVQFTKGVATHEHIPGDFTKTTVTCVLCCLFMWIAPAEGRSYIISYAMRYPLLYVCEF